MPMAHNHKCPYSRIFVFPPTDCFRSMLRFGPVPSKTSDEYHKHYSLIFTCLTTRALYLKMCSDVSTAAIINALRRFFARCGTPVLLVSNNATNFYRRQRFTTHLPRVHHFRTSWQTRKSNGSLIHHTQLTSVDYGSGLIYRLTYSPIYRLSLYGLA